MSRASQLAVAFLFMLTGTAFAQTLVPTYSSFVGATLANEDSVFAVATDAAGNVYVGGVTQIDLRLPLETGFPTTPSSLYLPNRYKPDNPCEHRCGYVLKLDRDHKLVYGALLPGMNVHALAVDGQGAVYATGQNSSGDSTLPNATPGAFSTDGSLFAIKLNAAGSALEYAAAFYGNEARAIAVDTSGNAYIVGEVAGDRLPTTPNAVKSQKNTFSTDAFLLKINSTGSAVVFGTYLGGSEYDGAYGVALDGAGGALVAGQTSSMDFVGLPFSGRRGANDAFVVHVSADGSGIVSGRLLGGSGSEYAAGLSSDGGGGYLVAGATTSSDFPVTPGVLQQRLLGERNGWLVRLGADLGVRYATYFGGSFDDGLLGVTSGPGGNAFVVGTTFSADMLTTPDGFQDVSTVFSFALLAGIGPSFYPKSDAAREAFLASISADGSQLLYGSYLGGRFTVPRDIPALTFGATVARAPDGTLAVGGGTLAASFPVAAGGLRDSLGGSQDGFLVLLAPQALRVTSPTLLPWGRVGSAYQYQLEAAAGVPPYDWTLVGFKLPDGLRLDPSGRISGTPTEQTEHGGYQFTARVTDGAGRVAHKSLFINMIYEGNATCIPTSCTLSVLVSQSLGAELPYIARGVPPFTFFVSGTLPPGISTDTANGTFGGTPTTAGVYDFSFTVRDTIGQSGTVSWRVTVSGQSLTPPIAPAPTPSPTPVANTSGGGGAFGGLGLGFLLLSAMVAARSRR